MYKRVFFFLAIYYSINSKNPSIKRGMGMKNPVWFQGTSLQNWTHLAIGNIYSQVDVSEAAAANSSY